MAILTGLEIDSAKSGIRPDLDEYLTHKTVKRSDFLKYKTLVEEMETRRAWYEPTHAVKVKSFFKKVDWSKVDSNVERLPYLAQQLKKNTPRIKARPAKDEELFSFARQSDWREQLNSDKLAAVEALLRDYDACLSRIRACRVPLKEKKRLFRESDSKAFTAMMSAFADKSASRSYRDAVTVKCRELLTAIVRPALAVRYVVALGRRDLLWELLPEYIEKNVLEVRDD